MKTVRVPVGAWYRDENISLEFPDPWEVTAYAPSPVPDVGEAAIYEALRRPIQSAPLEDLVSPNDRVCVIVDDLTRPTPTRRLLPPVLEALAAGGVKKERVTIVMAMGSHRPITRLDIEHKIGADIASDYEVIGHNAFQDNVLIGRTRTGLPIEINRSAAEADMCIGIGSINPHQHAGFSGGGKIVLPGISGIDTIEAFHRLGGGTNSAHGQRRTPVRDEIDDAVKLANLKFIVNVVCTLERGIAGVYAGDPIQAHVEGQDLSMRLFGIGRPDWHADVVIANTYPSDTELLQATKVLWTAEHLGPDGTLVILSEASEGVGYHGLVNPGGPFRREPDEQPRFKKFETRSLVVVSPHVNSYDVHRFFPRFTRLVCSWEEALAGLRLGGPKRVAVYACAPLQMYM